MNQRQPTVGGPPISHLPLPDPQRPWRNQSCPTCNGFCAGHYSSVLVDTTDQDALRHVPKPPSTVLKQLFTQLGGSPVMENFIEDAARSVNLSTEETKIWFDHLDTIVQNRRRGAAKAAVTRQAKKVQAQQSTSKQSSQKRHEKQRSDQTDEDSFCGKCGKEYSSTPTCTGEFWIGCDLCYKWYCCSCKGLSEEPVSETYLCSSCCNNWVWIYIPVRSLIIVYFTCACLVLVQGVQFLNV